MGTANAEAIQILSEGMISMKLAVSENSEGEAAIHEHHQPKI